MKRLLMVLLLVFSLVACDNAENDQVEVEKNTYESPYVKDYKFLVPIINEIYYNYHDVFAGVYLVNGSHHINITEDAPENLIVRLEQSSLVKHHIVKYSFAELWTIKEMVLDLIVDTDGFSSLGISEIDNTVSLTLITDTVVPTTFNHYIEMDILTIKYGDTYATYW